MRRRVGARLAIAAAAVVVAWGARAAWPATRLPMAAPIVVTTSFVERADTLRRDETLTHLFARHRIEGEELFRLLEVADAIDPRRVQAGQVFEFRYAAHETQPRRITVRLGDERLLTLVRDAEAGWSGREDEIMWTPERERAYGVIRSSLYETLHELIPDSILPPEGRVRLAWDLADGVFGWVVDFTRDLYEGDSVKLVYERLRSQFGDVRYGRVVAVRLETRGVENSAFALTGPDGGNDYYDAEGRSLKRAFKLYPVSFRRISSGFSRRRYHPILRTYRAHLGVDYSAMAGTEVMATGDGTVARAGRWGGYGIMVELRHAKGIVTRYAHLRALGRRIVPGARVRQGQTIGYVGMTGLATAPHVHYEFIKNGRHTDPRSAIKFGDGEPVPADRRTEFARLKAYYEALLTPPRALPHIESAAAGLD